MICILFLSSVPFLLGHIPVSSDDAYYPARSKVVAGNDPLFWEDVAELLLSEPAHNENSPNRTRSVLHPFPPLASPPSSSYYPASMSRAHPNPLGNQLRVYSTTGVPHSSSSATATATATIEPVIDSTFLNLSLSQKRKYIQSNLLASFNAIDHRMFHKKEIPWRDVNVYGWPEQVVFYSSHLWSDSDAFILKQNLSNITIIASSTDTAVPVEESQELYKRLKDINKLTIGTEVINWRSDMKSLLPSLHLISKDYECWDSRNVEQIKQLIAILEEMPTKAIRKESRNPPPQPAGPRKRLIRADGKDEYATAESEERVRIHSLLLQKLSLLTSEVHETINWHQYRVVCWPSEVVFYNCWSWRNQDIATVARAIDQIFFLAVESPKPAPDLQYREQLYSTLNDLASQYFVVNCIPWFREIRSVMPTLHLSTSKAKQWTYRDVREVERLIQLLSDLLEKNGPIAQSLKKDQKQVLYKKLLGKCNEDLSASFKELPWSSLTVHNWPKRLPFYSVTNLTLNDIKLISENLHNIRFELKDVDAEQEKNAEITLETRCLLMEKLKQLFKERFNSSSISWTGLKRLYPDLCLTSRDHKNWKYDDIKQIEHIVRSLPSSPSSSSAEAVTSEPESDSHPLKRPKLMHHPETEDHHFPGTRQQNKP